MAAIAAIKKMSRVCIAESRAKGSKEHLTEHLLYLAVRPVPGLSMFPWRPIQPVHSDSTD